MITNLLLALCLAVSCTGKLDSLPRYLPHCPALTSSTQAVTECFILQVKSLKVFPLHSQSQPARVSVASIQNATLSRPSFKKFKLQTEDHLDAFTARRCCGKLLVVGLADQGLGPLAAFQGLTLTVTDNKDGYLTISAGQKVDVDLADVNNQLQRQVLSAEFR